jgi:rare lipoprotein A (peptidoglycan hydrolase)
MSKAILSAAFVVGLFTSTCSTSLAYEKIPVASSFMCCVDSPKVAKKPKYSRLNVRKILSKPFVYLTGIASWYGPNFEGRTTASGTIFNGYRHICAMRYMRLGTLITVRNLANGLSTTCRVEDRGPFVWSRIIDVSWAVKRAIGMQGLAYVSISYR